MPKLLRAHPSDGHTFKRGLIKLLSLDSREDTLALGSSVNIACVRPYQHTEMGEAYAHDGHRLCGRMNTGFREELFSETHFTLHAKVARRRRHCYATRVR